MFASARGRLSKTGCAAGVLAILLSTGCSVELREVPAPVSEPGAAQDEAASEGGAPSAGGAAARDGLGSGDLTVLMVVDRSGSMNDSWDGQSKWDVVRGALDHAIVGVEEELTIGTLFFPLDHECGVSGFEHPGQFPFQKGADYQARLNGESLWPSGGTPLLAALQEANQAIETATMEGRLEERFRVVLMTDGEPTCHGSRDEMVALTDQWRDLGVDVRVLGFPGSEGARILLDRLAGKEVQEGEPWAPPSSVVDTDADSSDQGYVAPEDPDDVDDSVYKVVR